MILLLDLIIAAFFGIIIYYIKDTIRKRNLTEPINFNTILECFLGGATIYMGVASIAYSFSNSLPFGLTTIVSENYITFFGGLILVLYTLGSLFGEEISSNRQFIFNKGKEVKKISVDDINYYYAYKKYKENTNNPELKVIKVFEDGTIQVDTRMVENYLKKELLFDLKIITSEIIEDNYEFIPSKEIATCKLDCPAEISIFKILNWNNIKEYKDDIKDLKQNRRIDEIKPFITLKSIYLADGCSLQDLENIKNGIDKLIRIQAGV